MKAFLLLLFSIVCCAVAQRRQEPTPRPDGTEAPPTPRCGLDSFSIARNCHTDCLQTDESTGCITSCNLACNRTRSMRLCPSLNNCTLGCVLRVSDRGCQICQCEEPDDPDGQPDGEIDPCRVNATTFAVFERCSLQCLVRRNVDQCFMCNRTCNETAMIPAFRDECGVEDSVECPEGRVCLLEGVLNRCVRRPSNGEMCDREDPRDLDDGDDDDDEFREELGEDDRDFFSRVEGSADRLRAFSIQASAEIEPCADGYECRRSGDSEECTRITGPCINRTTMDAQVTCDEDGNFDPLQCRRMNDGTRTCYCVFPGNGSMVAGTMRTGIREREDAPDCVARVFRRCYYRQGNRNFTVRHGEVLVDRDTCVRCRCNDGTAVDCERDPQVDCRRLNPGMSPQDCTRGAITVEHGTRMRVGKCNMCGCNNGRLTCTDVEACEDEEEEEEDEQKSRCKRCQEAPQRLVCGRDGRTYLSRCAAMNCSRRLRDVDILDGPCSSQPVCSIHPCRSGYICIPLGGRSCLRNEGCTADERRICVNRTALRCRVSNRTRDGFNTTEENALCGSDRRNYMSICHLIQQGPPNTRVAYSGSCYREECRSGQVCGTDGVTYNSTCHLRTHSANAQVDYRGECEDTNDGKNVQEICRRVREDRERCENTQETCQQRVMSRDGCCPVCGGITTLAIDRDALDEYSRATGSDANLDKFMARMTRDDVISDEVRRRCRIEVSHVRNTTETNIEVKMMAKDRRADAEFCHTSSNEFADRINDEDVADETIVTALPVEASFASAAVAAPLIEDDGSSSAPGLLASFISLLAAATMAAIF